MDGSGITFVFGRFNDNLFIAKHAVIFLSTPFSIACSFFKLLLAQNIFVLSTE